MLIYLKLQAAYSTVSNPEARKKYDKQYIYIKVCHQNKSKTMDTETSQKETSSAAGDREETQSHKEQRASWREERLQELSKNRAWQDIELSNAKKELDKLRRDIAKLQKKIDKEENEQSAKSGWRGFVSSYITKKDGKSEEKKTERERHLLDRRAICNIKEILLEGQKAKVKILETHLQNTDNDMSKIWREIFEEQRIHEQKEAERKAAQEEEKRRVENDRFLKEFQKRMAEVRRLAEAQMAWQRQQAMAREEEERRAAMDGRQDTAETRSRGAHAQWRAQYFTRRSATEASCQHKAWWDRICGCTICSRCYRVLEKYAFACPGCHKIACASCRDILKHGDGDHNRPTRQSFSYST